MFYTENLCYNCFQEKKLTGVCPYCGYDNRESMDKYPTAIKEGSILNGQYIVGRVLGQGGFGITYLALDHQLNIKVAIKEYLPDGMATRLSGTTHVSVYVGEKQDNFNYGAERFLDEARVLAKFIGNRNIVGVKSYFKENNTAYFVMDYIEGISFKSYIKNHGGKIDYQDAMRVLLPVMDALALVHREGIIHRDVTPDNIYITKDNEVKLLDFGSARYSLGDKSKSLDVILKAGYAPKEQYIRRGKQGSYTDIYSLAACFYASITGYLPPEALERMENDEIVELSTRGFRIPQQMENAIMKGLEVRAEDRFQSIEEFKRSIEGNTEPNPFVPVIVEPPVTQLQRSNLVEEVTQNEIQEEQNAIKERQTVIQEGQNPIKEKQDVIQEKQNAIKEKQNVIQGEQHTTQEKKYVIYKKQKKIKEKQYTIKEEKSVTDGNIKSEPAFVSSSKKINTIVKFLLNKRNLLIASAACALMVLAFGITRMNKQQEDTAISISSGEQGSRDAGLSEQQDDNSRKTNEIASISNLPEEIKAAEEEGTIENVNELDITVDDTIAITENDTENGAISDKTTEGEAITDKSNLDEVALDKTTSDKVTAEQVNIDKEVDVNTIDVANNVNDKKTASSADKVAAEKAEAEKVAAEKVAAEKVAAEKAAADKVAAEKVAAEKAAAEKVAAEKAAAEKVAAEKVAAEKAAAEKAAADKAAAEADKYMQCSYCGGSGVIPCFNCKGSGICPSIPTDNCYYCGGSGVETCGVCNGTGKVLK